MSFPDGQMSQHSDDQSGGQRARESLVELLMKMSPERLILALWLRVDQLDEQEFILPSSFLFPSLYHWSRRLRLHNHQLCCWAANQQQQQQVIAQIMDNCFWNWPFCLQDYCPTSLADKLVCSLDSLLRFIIQWTLASLVQRNPQSSPIPPQV